MRCADLVAHIVPAPNHQSELRGIGSYRGAVMVGAVVDPAPITTSTGYHHEIYPVFEKGAQRKDGSLLQVVPAAEKSAIGFGASKGELRMSLPFLFFLQPPPRGYRVVYAPYYFFLLIGLAQPARAAFKSLRRKTAI